MITHKVWTTGQMLFINTDSREMAEQLDNLLWTYHDISFIPHDLLIDNKTKQSPVMIGWQKFFPQKNEVLLNLASEIPTEVERFARIIEIVSGDGSLRQLSRDKYRTYRDRGYELHNHSIESDYDHS